LEEGDEKGQRKWVGLGLWGLEVGPTGRKKKIKLKN